MNEKIKFFFMLVAVFLISGCTNQSADQEKLSVVSREPVNQKQIDEEQEQGEKMIQEDKALKAPKMNINTEKTYKAVLSTTEGAIIISLFADKTPITVNNFVSLARKDFYNNTIFHRVMKNFMIQGGDPQGNGTGGSGYKFDDEPFKGEYKRGIVAMANSGPNTNGSQFFIMHSDYGLPKNYVIFGEVTEGMEVVDKIAEAPVEKSASGENSKPVNPVAVGSVEILEE